jgi:oligopeptide transport system substrate-binding protein
LLDAYKNGEIDLDAAVSPDLTPQIMSDTLKDDFHVYDGARTYALAFNNTLKPFNDRIVRTAFSQALDRAGFVNDVLLGAGEPTTRWIPAGVPGNQADKPGVPASDAQAAVKTLVDNGYGTADGKVDCAKLGEIKFTYSDTTANKQQVEYIAKNLQNVFGCPITPNPVPPMQFTVLVRDVKTNPQLSLQNWVEDFPHPQNWLSTYWTCGSFAKRYGYCNVFVDQLLKQANATVDFEAAAKLYQQAEDLIVADVPGAFMYNPKNLQLVKPYVFGPAENVSARDAGWIGQWGPFTQYDIDLANVPPSYPKQ